MNKPREERIQRPGIALLPPELLSIIFLAARDSEGRFPKDAAHIEITISHVNSFWRTTALTNAAFWSRISIDCPSESKHALSRARCYISRSSSFPIDVLIQSYNLRFPSPTLGSLTALATLKAATQLILEHIHRVRRLAFRCSSNNESLVCQDLLIATSAPILRSFSMKITYPFGFYLDERHIFVDGATQLRYFYTSSPETLPTTNSLRSVVHFGLDRLRYISLSTLVQTILPLCSLRHLSLSGSFDGPLELANPPGTLVLPNLLSLRLKRAPSLALGLLTNLEAHNLNSLWLDSRAYNIRELLERPEMKHPKFPRLQYLTITQTFSQETHQLLHNIFPSVTHLHCACVEMIFARDLAHALLNGWHKVHTVIVSKFTENPSYTSVNLARYWATPLCKCLAVDHSLKTLLVDTKERVSFIHVSESNPTRSIQVESLHSDNYDEYWWNTDEWQ